MGFMEDFVLLILPHVGGEWTGVLSLIAALNRFDAGAMRIFVSGLRRLCHAETSPIVYWLAALSSPFFVRLLA